VLAYAGGPVSARIFRASFFRIFCCIKVSDSLADGLSYFYAEVKRLRAILDSVNNHPDEVHFVLIDEIFGGTNNRERRIGSLSYIRALADLPVIGAVATHDLELIKLEQEIPAVTNEHFREEIVDGRMVFDYRIHRGPCPTTNALRIMEIEGLPVSASREV
jgi:DNA mismatch repair ATPase MutS